MVFDWFSNLRYRQSPTDRVGGLIKDIKVTTDKVSKDIDELKYAVSELYKQNHALVKRLRKYDNE